MERWRRNVLLGLVASLLVTPLVGGAVVGYLNGPDGREMLRSGGVVGAVTGAIQGCLLVLLGYAWIVRPRLAFDEHASLEGLMTQYLAYAAVLLVASVVLAILGAGFGNALAYRRRARGDDRTATS